VGKSEACLRTGTGAGKAELHLSQGWIVRVIWIKEGRVRPLVVTSCPKCKGARRGQMKADLGWTQGTFR
jgi:hypothetical protein